VKRIASILLAGILALSVAVPAFAAGGTATENLTVPSTLTFTLDTTSITYQNVKGTNSATISMSNISTDAPTGLTVTMTPNADGTGLIPLSSRGAGSVTPSGGNLDGADDGVGEGTMPTTWTLIDTGAHSISASGASFVNYVYAAGLVPGVYSGSLVFVASTK
jgi:hypothetical protein